jgi:hypothetical protein
MVEETDVGMSVVAAATSAWTLTIHDRLQIYSNIYGAPCFD